MLVEQNALIQIRIIYGSVRRHATHVGLKIGLRRQLCGYPLHCLNDRNVYEKTEGNIEQTKSAQ